MFKKALKESCNLWAAIYGASGSGKTMTALRIATGMNAGKIAVIDTERGSSAKYADRFTFDICTLENKTIDEYLKVIKEAGIAGYKVLIIDSMTHAWNELIEEVEKIAKLKYNGNNFRAWSEGTPKQKDFIEGILSFPGHVIVTMRSKTEWAVEVNDKGKMQPRKIGLAPEQGKNIEYEFDLLITMNGDNVGKIEKDRTGKFHGQFIDKPGEQFGKALSEWLTSGVVKDTKGTPKTETKTVETTVSAEVDDLNIYETAKQIFKEYCKNKQIQSSDIQSTFENITIKLFNITKKKFAELTEGECIAFINYFAEHQELEVE